MLRVFCWFGIVTSITLCSGADPAPRGAFSKANFHDSGGVPCSEFVLLPVLAPELISQLEQPGTGGRKNLQVGLGRSLDQPIKVGASSPAAEWLTAADGTRTYAVSVAAPGALGLRVHIQNLYLPKGAKLLVYDPADPGKTTAEIGAEQIPASREIWTPTLFTDRVAVEAQALSGAQADVNFQIKEVSQVYKYPPSGPRKLEGSCHNDVSCYPAFADEARGVMRITFIDHGNMYVCSGGLLSTSSSGYYVLTANHCISDQSHASSSEFYWLFQTDSCNGPAPDLASAAATRGGADLLAHSVTTDFSFIRLKQAPPSGVRKLNWSLDTPSASEVLTCIHHPDGAYKRLSVGRLIGIDPAFWGVQWTSGATEDGSSGGPLFNSQGDVIGQLDSGFHGPGSSCDAQSEPDQFGRMDLTYQSIRQWLSGNSGGSGSTGPWLNASYNGLVYDEDAGVSPDTAGSISLRTTSKSKVTGKLTLGRSSYSFSGTLDENGQASLTLTPKNAPRLYVNFQISPDDLTHASGTVGTASFTAQFNADLASFDGKKSSAPQAGQYTVVLPGQPGSADQPGGDSYGTVTIDRAGRIRFAGSLADGTKVSQSSVLSPAGQWPLYDSLYGGRGMLIGWVNFGDTGDSDVSGQVYWTNPGRVTRYYPGGFNWAGPIIGSVYSRAATLDLSNGAVVLEGGDLGSAVNPITTNSRGRIVNQGSGKLSVSVSSNGTFKGSLAGGGVSRPVTFTGVVLDRQNIASGYFLQGTQSGRAQLRPGEGQ